MSKSLAVAVRLFLRQFRLARQERGQLESLLLARRAGRRFPLCFFYFPNFSGSSSRGMAGLGSYPKLTSRKSNLKSPKPKRIDRNQFSMGADDLQSTVLPIRLKLNPPVILVSTLVLWRNRIVLLPRTSIRIPLSSMETQCDEIATSTVLTDTDWQIPIPGQCTAC